MDALTTGQINARVRAALRDVLGEALDSVSDEDDLRTVLGERYDSLEAMACITRLESEFGIEVDFVAHDVRFNFARIARMSRFVRDQLEDKANLDLGP